jgi:hypothetical protein
VVSHHILEPTTRESYRYNLDRHILPWFGPMQIGDILAIHVRQWVTELVAAGVSPATIRHQKIILTRLHHRTQRLHPRTARPRPARIDGPSRCLRRQRRRGSNPPTTADAGNGASASSPRSSLRCATNRSHKRPEVHTPRVN